MTCLGRGCRPGWNSIAATDRLRQSRRFRLSRHPRLRHPLAGFRNFPEVNLRFYVRADGSAAWSSSARLSPCGRSHGWPGCCTTTVRCHAIVQRVTETRRHPHRGTPIDRARSDPHDPRDRSEPRFRPGSDTVEHFFKEHHWGYGGSRRGVTRRYEVQHPEWDVYPVRDFKSTSIGRPYMGRNGRSCKRVADIDGAIRGVRRCRISPPRIDGVIAHDGLPWCDEARRR